MLKLINKETLVAALDAMTDSTPPARDPRAGGGGGPARVPGGGGGGHLQRDPVLGLRAQDAPASTPPARSRSSDLAVSGRPVTLVWHRRRFRCKRCRTTTTETHPFFVDRMTKRLARAVVADARDMTVAAVARRHHLSWHRVMRLVLAEGELLARARRRRPCRVLLVDEKSMRKGRGQFSTILTDGDRGRVIAVLKGRSADVLGGFLAAQSPSWRAGVSVVVTDMAECYRTAVRSTCPTPATWPTASTSFEASPRCW